MCWSIRSGNKDAVWQGSVTHEQKKEKDEGMRQAAVHGGGTMARWLCRAKD
jgi:hypothetical protein